MDRHHVSYFLIVFLTVLLYNSNFIIKNKYITPISLTIIIFLMSGYYLLVKGLFDKYIVYSYHNFPIEFTTKSDKKVRDQIIQYIKDKNVIFITDRPDHITFYLSTTNKKMPKYLVQYHGNYGNNGYQNLKKDLLKEKNTYFIINNYISENDKSQFYRGLPNYIKKNCQYIKDIGNYSICYKD